MSNNSETTVKYRPPIVTVMGHVDHGKTSILDAIRKTDVQTGEYGGITQHIGAYQISYKNREITFIDTPGHAAFTQMRARGGKAADIVVLVVAADSGVQPQTREAIAHAQAAKATIIVAINKVDLPGSDIQKIKKELSIENVLVEDWGGDIICVEVSAKTGHNLDKLLDSILAVADLLSLKSHPDSELEAIIVEAKKDKARGPVVSAIVRSGTLHISDKITASGKSGKVKSLMSASGKSIPNAVPGMPVEILGFKELPNVGDLVLQEGSDLAALAVDETREEIIGQNTKKVVTIVLRSDTQGTLEAVKASLANLVTSSVEATYSIKFLLCATGDITDSDIMLASNGDGIVVGFNVKLPSQVSDLATESGVIAKTYKTIYDLIDEVKDLLEGTATFEEKKIKGRAQILKTFKLESGDLIIGCRVLAGALKDTSRVAIYTKNPSDITELDTPLYTGAVKKLKIGKDEVKLVGKDNECGLLLKPQFENAIADMWIEVL